MELRQLQYFMQICESGSILKAANNLYITQQAVSKSIAALERELGASLFYRTAKGSVLTQFGQELRKNCLPVMVSMENLNRNMEKALRFNSGKLRIGVSGGLMFLNSKKIWTDFEKLYPNIQIEAAEHGYKDSMDMLDRGELDAVIISDLDQVERKEDYILFRLPSASRSLIVNKSNPLAEYDRIDIGDLKNEKFILYINEFAYREFVRLCLENGFEPDIQRTSDTIYMCALCNSDGMTGIIISFLADRMLDHFSNIKLVPFGEPILEYSLGVIARRSFAKLQVLQELADYLTYSLQDNM